MGDLEVQENKFMIIGISGPARCGKDTFANSLVQYFANKKIKAVRMALADELKREVRPFLLETLGIDSFTTNDEEKEKIRPFLVFWGTEVRRKLNESHWIEKLQQNAPKDSLVIVSDIRYPNEQKWLKDQDGYSIFIDRCSNGKLLDGANEYERKYNPILRKRCDHNFVWDTLLDRDGGNQILDAIVDDVANMTFSKRSMDVWKLTYSL